MSSEAEYKAKIQENRMKIQETCLKISEMRPVCMVAAVILENGSVAVLRNSIDIGSEALMVAALTAMFQDQMRKNLGLQAPDPKNEF